ncbi:MAG: molybdopterin molybdotransferase MoeA [Lentisphaeria bacterium]|nr:molybdopterin molybdotransferase MoeA [Lentisphaeria bacterium]
MISVEEASNYIDQYFDYSKVETIALADAASRILAKPVYSDREHPPFHRVAMDGIAVSHKVLESGKETFPIEGIHGAGAEPPTLKNNHACFEVMTGAVLPIGCDCVIPYEHINLINEVAKITKAQDHPQWKNIHLQGSDHAQGTCILSEGTVLSAPAIAVAASAGYSIVDVYLQPKVAVLSTGDELVEIETTPLPWQIRKSNGFSIACVLNNVLSIEVTEAHLLDTKEDVKKHLENLLDTHDILILSGGVSKGKFDYIPICLEELGVEKVFHGVQQRPGKPFFFGRKGKQLVFGLPGNPVSAVTTCERYIIPQLLKGPKQYVKFYVELASDFSFKPKLTRFLPVTLQNKGTKTIAVPVMTNGSGDYATLAISHGFIELPPDPSEFKEGTALPYYPWTS